MEIKSTDELEKILGKTHLSDISDYLGNNEESIINNEYAFHNYVRELIKKKNLKQQDVYLAADIPEKYGYKLLSGEKRTRQRDVILRLCYAAEFDLDETQKALKLYRMPEDAQVKLQETLERIINEGSGGLICIIL